MVSLETTMQVIRELKIEAIENSEIYALQEDDDNDWKMADLVDHLEMIEEVMHCHGNLKKARVAFRAAKTKAERNALRKQIRDIKEDLEYAYESK